MFKGGSMTSPSEMASSTTPRIADTVADLTPSWFTRVLREGGTIADGDAVTSADAEPIGTGQVGLVLRAHLGYDASAADAPARLVVKLPSPDAGSREMAATMGLYEAEVRFYEEIAPRLGPAIPKVHWGQVDAPNRFTLVLDDLSRTADVGNMVAGCGPDQAALAIDQLADFQAPVWGDPDLPGRPWLDPMRTDMMFGAVQPAVDLFLERFADRLEPEHLELVRRLAPRAAGYRARVWEPPYVVAHSDYRLDNMLFGRRPDAPPISVVDWQGARLGPPLLDAAVFLASCVTPADRRAHERDLLRSYHDRLVAAGVDGFSYGDCLESYRRCSLWPFLLGVAVSVTVVQTERGDAMWARLMSGAAELVLDTGAAGLLE
jgi:aminoglycoside/choline kinase family phosphotransferase